MERFQEIISCHLPANKAQGIITQAKKYSDLSEKQKADKEAEIFNQLVGKLTDYDCPKCKNKGLIYKAVERTDVFGSRRCEVVSAECECMKVRNEIRRIKQSGISRLIQKNTFDNYRTVDDWQHYIMITARRYVNNPEGWFYIGGQPGCGKTHICTAIVGELLKQGKEAKYMLWQDDITTLKQVVNDNSAYDSLIGQFKKAEILYIDDFFKARQGNKVSAADINMTFKIINYRYNEGLNTIISSELSVFDIAEIDEALGSRIAEMCRENVIFIKPDRFKNYRYKFGNGHG